MGQRTSPGGLLIDDEIINRECRALAVLPDPRRGSRHVRDDVDHWNRRVFCPYDARVDSELEVRVFLRLIRGVLEEPVVKVVVVVKRHGLLLHPRLQHEGLVRLVPARGEFDLGSIQRRGIVRPGPQREHKRPGLVQRNLQLHRRAVEGGQLRVPRHERRRGVVRHDDRRAVPVGGVDHHHLRRVRLTVPGRRDGIGNRPVARCARVVRRVVPVILGDDPHVVRTLGRETWARSTRRVLGIRRKIARVRHPLAPVTDCVVLGEIFTVVPTVYPHVADAPPPVVLGIARGSIVHCGVHAAGDVLIVPGCPVRAPIHLSARVEDARDCLRHLHVCRRHVHVTARRSLRSVGADAHHHLLHGGRTDPPYPIPQTRVHRVLRGTHVLVLAGVQ